MIPTKLPGNATNHGHRLHPVTGKPATTPTQTRSTSTKLLVKSATGADKVHYILHEKYYAGRTTKAAIPLPITGTGGVR